MDDSALVIVTILGVFVIVGLGLVVLYARCIERVDQGQALVITRLEGAIVSFTTALVIPIVHRAEHMDLSVQSLQLERRGKDGVVCRDNIRADLSLTFYVRVGKTTEDVLKVAESIGCARATHADTLEGLLGAKLADAVASVAKQLDFMTLYQDRSAFLDAVLERIGEDLGGYVIEDLAVDYLEQTPIEHLDPNNILDAEGIRKITEITSRQRIETAELERGTQQRIATLEHELKELLIEQEARRGDALGRFRELTGRDLTEQQLDEQIERRLDELSDARAARGH